MEDLKHLLGPAAVATLCRGFAQVWPGFAAERFEALCLHGLDALALKARADHIARALEQTLPTDFEHGARLIEQALQGEAGLRDWPLWPVGVWISQRGLHQPARALQALHAMTQRFTAEWALRPFLVHHPEVVYPTLARWAQDPQPTVRRLVSEGTRPRLPWGQRLPSLVADPSPNLPLLAALQDDPSETVRRSVANHLNDIAKDHPTLLVQWLQVHLPGASPERRRLLRHASRSLIKQGHPAVLGLWGVGQPWRGEARLRVAPARLRLGEALVIDAELVASPKGGAQAVEVDWVMHFRKANGRLAPKVFKGVQRTLAAGQMLHLSKQWVLKPLTTRTYHTGEQRLVLQINGQAMAEAAFELIL
jgi:3-methyladenine DNA glycosylase AlkC